MDPSTLLTEMKEQDAVRHSVIRSPWAIAGYVWDVIRNLITLFIVFTIYSNIYDPNTQLIFSGLLLLYISVLTMGAGLGQSSLQMGLLDTRLQLRTHKVLLSRADGPIDNEDLKNEEVELQKAGYALEKLQYKFYINAVFSCVLYVAAIYNLLDSV